MIIGNIAKTLVAIATPVAAAAACESVNLVSPIVTVHHFCASPEKISCGQLSEFHEPVKVNRTISIMVDLASGTIILVNILKLLAPSLRALSTISRGMDRKKLRISNILNIPDTPGITIQKKIYAYDPAELLIAKPLRIAAKIANIGAVPITPGTAIHR